MLTGFVGHRLIEHFVAGSMEACSRNPSETVLVELYGGLQCGKLVFEEHNLAAYLSVDKEVGSHVALIGV